MAARLGQPLMPWQQLVADVGGEIDPETGVPVYREVVLTVPRQSGKTTLILAWELQRALGWGVPQRIVYSAQTGKDAREKLIDDQMPVLEPRRRALGIRQLNRGVGNEGVWFTNGSAIKLLSSSEESGHGKTVDLAIKDEFFADDDDRRDQTLVPAMTTKALAQIVTATTAGTERSVPWNRKQELGRQYVLDGRTDTIAYFEWSADPETWDPDDEDACWEFMPALGHTIGLPAIRHARETLTAEEYRRAYGNIPGRSDERIIPSATWDAVNGPKHAGQGRMTFGVDVNEDRSAAAIVAVSADRVIEVVDHRPGLSWLAERCEEIAAKQAGSMWVIDGSGPAASLAPDLERRVRSLHQLKGGELARASATFYDAVADATIRVRRHPSLDDAVGGAARRITNDAWAWSRKAGTSDSSPLVAASLALWVSDQNNDQGGVNLW